MKLSVSLKSLYCPSAITCSCEFACKHRGTVESLPGGFSGIAVNGSHSLC